MKYLLLFIGIFTVYLSQAQTKVVFPSIAKLRAYGAPKGNDTTRYTPSAEAYIGRKSNTYFWSDTASTKDDSVNVVQPAGVTGSGRWLIASGQYVSTKGLLQRNGDVFEVNADSVRAALATAFASPSSVTAANNAAATASGQAQTAQGAASTNAAAISRDSTLIVAQKRSADSLLAAFVALKSTVASNAAAVAANQTQIQTNRDSISAIAKKASQLVQNIFTSKTGDSVLVQNSTQTSIVPGGYGSLNTTIYNIDTTKTYHYTQYYQFTGATALAASVASTIQVHLGTSCYAEIPIGTLAVIALGTYRSGKIDLDIKFKSVSGALVPIVNGFVKYETATQRIFYEYPVTNLVAIGSYSLANPNFYLTAGVNGGSMIFKDAQLELKNPLP